MMNKLVTDFDRLTIDMVIRNLKEVGKDDDVIRLQEILQGTDTDEKLKHACEIAIAYIKLSQDLKYELQAEKEAGYL